MSFYSIIKRKSKINLLSFLCILAVIFTISSNSYAQKSVDHVAKRLDYKLHTDFLPGISFSLFDEMNQMSFGPSLQIQTGFFITDNWFVDTSITMILGQAKVEDCQISNRNYPPDPKCGNIENQIFLEYPQDFYSFNAGLTTGMRFNTKRLSFKAYGGGGISYSNPDNFFGSSAINPIVNAGAEVLYYTDINHFSIGLRTDAIVNINFKSMFISVGPVMSFLFW